MAQTVTEILTVATDSVNLINGVKAGSWYVENMTQAKINKMVQINVNHLKLILEYDDPDVKGSSEDKSSYTAAIATGETYIAAN